MLRLSRWTKQEKKMNNPKVGETYYGRQSFAPVKVEEINGRYAEVRYEGSKDTTSILVSQFFKKFSESNPRPENPIYVPNFKENYDGRGW